MKKIFYTLLISLLFLMGTNIIAQDCADSANIYFFTYAGANYEIVKENLSWIDAVACAVERGGFLSEIDSQEEQDSIFYHLNNAGINAANTIAPDGGGASYMWLGGNDVADEGAWFWDGDNDGEGDQFWEGNYNGTPVNGLYNNWGDEPDNWNNQDALGLAITNWPLGIAGQWNDVDDSNTLYYVIEYENSVGILESCRSTSSVLISPNPATDKINIVMHDGQKMTHVTIYNQIGLIVLQKDFSENFNGSINVSTLQTGLYFVKIALSNGDTESTSLLIK